MVLAPPPPAPSGEGMRQYCTASSGAKCCHVRATRKSAYMDLT